jgi:hypothetical protein
MYPIDENDRVVELDGIPKPVTGAPEPIVVASWRSADVLFREISSRPYPTCLVLVQRNRLPTLTGCHEIPNSGGSLMKLSYRRWQFAVTLSSNAQK